MDITGWQRNDRKTAKDPNRQAFKGDNGNLRITNSLPSKALKSLDACFWGLLLLLHFAAGLQQAETSLKSYPAWVVGILQQMKQMQRV